MMQIIMPKILYNWKPAASPLVSFYFSKINNKDDYGVFVENCKAFNKNKNKIEKNRFTGHTPPKT